MVNGEIIMDANIIIAIASVFIATCALLFTAWQGWETRKHNKISVRPILTGETFDAERYSVEKDIRRVSLEIINSGIGPAIIKSFVLIFDDEEIARNDVNAYCDFMKQKLRGMKGIKGVDDIDKLGLGFLMCGSVMKEGDKQMIWDIKYINKDDPQNDNIATLYKITLIVEYQSVYDGDVFTFDTREYHKAEKDAR